MRSREIAGMLVPIYCISGIPLFSRYVSTVGPRSPAKPPHFCLCRERGPHVPTRDAPEQGGCAYPTPSGACPYPSNLIAIAPPDSSRCLQARPAAEPSQTSTSCAGGLVRAKIRFTIRSTSTTFVQNLRKQSWRLRCPVIESRFAQRPTSKYTCRQGAKQKRASLQAKHNEHPDQDSHFGQPPSLWISLLRRGGWSLPAPP